MVKFNNKYRPKPKEDKEKYTYKRAYALSEWQNKLLLFFKVTYFK